MVLTGGDIEGVTAGDGHGRWQLSDFNELTGATADVSADSIAFIDATDNSTKKESIAEQWQVQVLGSATNVN